MSLAQALSTALSNREELRAALEAEGTDSLRLFHGVTEGRPGLSIDQYGTTTLGQLWGIVLTEEEQTAVAGQFPDIIWRIRGVSQAHTAPTWCREGGRQFAFQAIHKGIDPWMFLDFRAGRRWLAAHVSARPGCSVLNTFAYTATAGVVAASAGAGRVVNVDHARQWTRIGRENAARNQVEMTFLQLDYFAAVRQMAGLKVGRRGRRLPRVAREDFDAVVLDPPTRTKGPFGAVDIVHDYPGLFKPAWLCLKPGGALLATNHSAQVSLEDWLAQCQRCAEKAGRPVEQITVLPPDADFPSFDGSPPLKMAVFQ